MTFEPTTCLSQLQWSTRCAKNWENRGCIPVLARWLT